MISPADYEYDPCRRKDNDFCEYGTCICTGRDEVALLDGDLRKPSVSELMKLPEGPGLTEYFRGESTPEEIQS